MENITFKTKDIEPLYIFEYYDSPIIFISNRIDEDYYFFYLIDDNQYFLKTLSAKDINLIFSSYYIKDFLDEFLKSDDFKIIEFKTDDKAILFTIDEFEKILGESIESCLPENEIRFEYEYVNKIPFLDLKDSYKNSFPELFNNQQLIFKLRDEKNSNTANPSVVLHAIELMKLYISEKKKYLNDHSIFPNENLVLLPFSPGSFNINFELSLPKEVSIFEEDQLDFDDFIMFIDSLGSDSPEVIYEELIYESSTIIKAASEFYNEMKEYNLEVELLNHDKKLARIAPNPKIEKTLSELESISKTSEEGKEIREELKFKGEVLSATKKRNNISIALAGSSVNASFKKELFKEIKDSIKPVTISKEISGIWEKITIIDDNDQEIRSKYRILEYKQE